jgi:monoamine oxidase
MPRTALFNTLLRVARDHAEAHRRGVDVEALHEERRRARVSRRAFLGAAGAGAAALAIPAVARAGAEPRVAIVGGGISGLAAALALSDAKLTTNLTVYESTNRLGGRMYSNSPALGPAYWDSNQVTEWCGELVDSGHVTVQHLCMRYGLPLDDLLKAEPPGSTLVYWFGGAYYTLDQVNQDFGPVFTQIMDDANAAIPDKKSDGSPNVDGTVLWDAITPAGVALDNMSVHDWIAKKVPGGYGSNMGKLLDAAYASEFGADCSDQSALNLVLLLSGLPGPTPFYPFGASDERYHIRGGNQQLPLAIAKDLQGKFGSSVIQMNSALTKIAKNADGTIALTFSVTSGGSTTTSQVTADAVILTLPFAVLADSVDFTQAGFDARKTQAIQQLGRGLCSKLQLQFTSRLWSTQGAWGIDSGEETFSDNGDQCSWDATRGQPGTTGIMNGYTGGTPTVDRAMVAPVAFGKVNMGPQGAGIATLATTFLGQLEQIFPGITPLYNGKATLSLPHLAPNFKLAYSFWKVGQYQAFAGYERTPQGNVFFGGEHTSVNFQGYMEGGASEGVRAATEVIAAFAPKPPPMTSSSSSGNAAPYPGGGCATEPAPATAASVVPVAALLAGLALRARREG